MTIAISLKQKIRLLPDVHFILCKNKINTYRRKYHLRDDEQKRYVLSVNPFVRIKNSEKKGFVKQKNLRQFSITALLYKL